jgi:hypothetical protein
VVLKWLLQFHAFFFFLLFFSPVVVNLAKISYPNRGFRTGKILQPFGYGFITRTIFKEAGGHKHGFMSFLPSSFEIQSTCPPRVRSDGKKSKEQISSRMTPISSNDKVKKKKQQKMPIGIVENSHCSRQ